MANNVTTQSATLATIPTGTVFQTVDIGSGVQRQVVQIEPGAGPIAVTASISSTASLARVAANSSGLTTASTAYAANDQLGAIIELTSAVSSSGGYGTIVGATLLDKAKIVGAVSAYLFDRSVTVATDNTAADFSDSDMENCLGILEFPPPVSGGSNALAQIEPLALPIKSNATSLWVALVTRAGHTFFGAASDLRVTLMIEH